MCLELGADLHMAQLMPLPLAASCFGESRLVLPFRVVPEKGSLNGCVCQAQCTEFHVCSAVFSVFPFPFLQILLTVTFFFFFRIDYVDSPDCLLLFLCIISVFLLFSFFSVLHFNCRFRAVDEADSCQEVTHTHTHTQYTTQSTLLAFGSVGY